MEGKADIMEGEADIKEGEADIKEGEADIKEGESDIVEGETDNMDSVLNLPDEKIDKLKCSVCNNYLIYFPITSLVEEDANVCGRCSIPEGKLGVHNRIFEEVVQHVSFPCRFKTQGCTTQTIATEMVDHEKYCLYQLVKCPAGVFVECSWEGALNSMLSHCRDSHDDLFLKNKTFEINLNDSNPQKKLLKYNGTCLGFWLNFDSVSNTLSHVVYHVENLENYSYQILLSKNKKKIIDESVTTFVEKNWSEIALDSLTRNNDDNQSTILGSIAFEMDIADTTLIEGFNDHLPSLLRCGQCKSYMLPPIKKVGNNLIICDECGDRDELEVTYLDKVAEYLSYPCRYKENGCDVILKSEKMRKHLLICQFNDRKYHGMRVRKWVRRCSSCEYEFPSYS